MACMHLFITSPLAVFDKVLEKHQSCKAVIELKIISKDSSTAGKFSMVCKNNFGGTGYVFTATEKIVVVIVVRAQLSL